MEMKTRSIRIAGVATSIRLEVEYWEEIELLAEARGVRLSALATELSIKFPGNLARAVRLEILHAKNVEISNLRRMITSVSKMALEDITPPVSGKIRAVR